MNISVGLKFGLWALEQLGFSTNRIVNKIIFGQTKYFMSFL